MEIAKLALEFIKVLVWPVVIVVLVVRFRSALQNIIHGLGDRLRTAESLKLGVMGQQVEISGTAKELLERRDELIRTAGHDESARGEAARIQASAERLQNPISDIVGISLLRAGREGLRVEEIVKSMLAMLAPSKQQPPLALLALADEADKILKAMEGAGLAEQRKDRAVLTPKGVELFTAVERRQSALLRRFHSLGV